MESAVVLDREDLEIAAKKVVLPVAALLALVALLRRRG
jgi:hypothetical protein